MKLFIVAIFVLCIIPVMSFAIAQEESRIFLVIIQMIQRDNDGNLIAYIETDDVTEINHPFANFILDQIGNEKNSKFIDFQGTKVQIITQTTPLSTDASGLLATVKYQLIDNTGVHHDVVRFSHDGMRLTPDEHITVIWTFMRYV